jgi:Ricin-type beta-trefoil lectin domain-like
MKSILNVLAVVGALAVLPSTGWSFAFESTAKFATWTSGSYTVANDVWGPSPGPQTIWANSGSNWGVFTDQSGSTSIQSYPHVEFNSVNSAVNSLPTINSSFNGTAPSGSSYDFAYDIWLNGSTYEVMIWNQWVNTKPIAKSYNAQGQAIPTYTNITIDGITYDVYTGTGGSGPCMSFLRHNQVGSGTINITDILKWINTTGWYNNPTLRSIQNGWEIIKTSGQQNFTMNSYSVTVTTGGGGGTVANGTYKIINRNSGQALDVVGAGTANGVLADQWPYGAGSNQKWTVTSLGGGQYKVIGVGSGKGLDVVGNASANGTGIDIYTYSGNANQKWSFTATSGGYYRLTPANATGSCMDVTGSSTANGALTELWTYSGGNSQQWSFQAP